MTFHLSSLMLAAAAPPSKPSGGSSPVSLLFLLAIVAAGYFLIIRPRKARLKAQRTQATSLEIGSEVMSVGGIMGTIVGMTDATFDVEVAPGVVMTFVRRAINPRPATAVTTSDDDLPADPWDAEVDGPGRQTSQESATPDEHGPDGQDNGGKGTPGHPGPDGETDTGSGGFGSGDR